MSTPYMGQITTYAFGLIPKGWAACNGQLLSIQQNQALFSLLGTTYGGNGTSTFALPNLQGLMPISFGSGGGGNYVLGETGGEVNHTLLLNEMPTHNHPMTASGATGPLTSLTGNYPAAAVANQYATVANTTLDGGSSYAGGSAAHPNQQPYLALSFCIATSGIFPTRG